MNEKTEALMVKEREEDYVNRYRWYYGGAAPYPPSWIEEEGLLLVWTREVKSIVMKKKRDKVTKKYTMVAVEEFDYPQEMFPAAWLHLELNIFSGRV